MSIWEKIGFGKKQELSIDDEIAKAEGDIANKSRELENFRRSFPLADTNNKELELQGLRDKLALLQDKKRHEGQKTVEGLDELNK